MVGNLPLWTLARMDCGLEIYVKDAPETRWTDRNIDHYVLMQFTGLKGKNGKEIYDGDITSWGRVRWNDVYCRWEVENRALEMGLVHEETSKVIGNICENPDLLK